MSTGSTAGSPRSTRLLHWPTPDEDRGARRSGVHGSLPSFRWPTYNPCIDILLVCTANQCRSPMAEGLLRRLFAQAGVGAQVGSAGLLPGGAPATADAVATMAGRRHRHQRPRQPHPRPRAAGTTPLVIGMARQHVREACVLYGAPVERTFTLKELVRRGEQAGGRRADEPVAAWLARVGAGPPTADLVGDDPADDIADPVGRPRRRLRGHRRRARGPARRLVDLLVGRPPPPPSRLHRS